MISVIPIFLLSNCNQHDKIQRFAKFKKIMRRGFRVTLNLTNSSSKRKFNSLTAFTAVQNDYTTVEVHLYDLRNSGAQAARRAAKRSPLIIEKGTTRMHRNRNTCNSFLMVKMASGMDHAQRRRRRRRTTSHNMAAIQLIPSHVVLDYSIYH